jgi:uncharacterized protein YbbK (DUF523 family)
MDERVIRLGISACLLGERVRYDGGHKLDHFLADTLGRYIEWVPVCPEVEIGLPIPREAVRLVGDPDSPRLIVPKSGVDHTDTMRAWARKRLEELAAVGLCGFVFKKDSPSSGLFRVRVYDEHGNPSRTGTGIFPHAVMQRFPLLPLEEEGRLNDLPLRENFIERVFRSPELCEGAYYRWTEMLKGEPTRGGLVLFHTAHKLTLMAHSIKHYQELGRLAAQAGALPWDELVTTYGAKFMEGLALLGTRRKHVNAEGAAPDGLSEKRAIERGQAGAAGAHRGLPAGVGATDCAAHPASAPPPSPPGAGVGGAAGVPQPIPQGADAPKSRVAPSLAEGWLSLRSRLCACGE